MEPKHNYLDAARKVISFLGGPEKTKEQVMEASKRCFMQDMLAGFTEQLSTDPDNPINMELLYNAVIFEIRQTTSPCLERKIKAIKKEALKIEKEANDLLFYYSND
jgi:hypothetical protein